MGLVGGSYGEVVGGRAPLAATAVAAAMDDAARKLKRRKDHSRSKKRARGRGGASEDAPSTRAFRDSKGPESLPSLSSQPSTTSTDSSNFSSAWDAANSVLEARRRKFESSVPIESSNKRIRLKKPDTEAEVPEDEDSSRTAPPSASVSESLVLATDDLEELLDLELENAMELWSDEESNSDNEARFKSSEKPAVTNDLPKIRVVPLSKLQGKEPGILSDKQEKEGRGRTRPFSSEEQHLHQIHLREGSRKGVKSHGQDMIVKEDNSEKETCSTSDIIDQERKRSKINLVVADMVEDAEEIGDGSKDGDLRAELSRRRAERLTMAGSVHETLPARLVQSAFKDAVGKKNFRRLDRERHGVSKRLDSQKGGETGDGRRVLVLKSSAVEQQIPSISVTIPKEEKHKQGGSPVSGGKVPIRMRLGLPGGGSNFPEERERTSGSRRRGSRKVKLKRNVLLASPAREKVMCGSSLSLTLGSMRHSLLCSLPTFLSPICGLLGSWSSVRAQLCHIWKLICSVQ